MKDKEKQIEEMSNYLRECSNNAWAKGFDYAEIDNEKLRSFLALLPKDSVVLSREELNELIKIKENCLELMKQGEQQIVNISKETAENIICIIKTFSYDKEFTKIITRIIAERFGVEIKE